ncbi:hypothetical protein BpHYR1_037302 [Brachionus plicatilis]|uniref:Uncharacterized protein n=1 Tax=Brachionus plicatilis TaxID=10195 RepID=A0A3M7RXW4_BRAPC|nr:hypothetical protein BpHYR1_037302 [Brachionus plicatilis]
MEAKKIRSKFGTLEIRYSLSLLKLHSLKNIKLICGCLLNPNDSLEYVVMKSKMHIRTEIRIINSQIEIYNFYILLFKLNSIKRDILKF